VIDTVILPQFDIANQNEKIQMMSVWIPCCWKFQNRHKRRKKHWTGQSAYSEVVKKRNGLGLVDEQIGKVQIHKEYKKKEQACRCTVVFALFSGILVADSSMNRLMNRESGPGWFTWHLTGHPLLYKILNEDIYINVKYIKKTLKN